MKYILYIYYGVSFRVKSFTIVTQYMLAVRGALILEYNASILLALFNKPTLELRN